MNLSSETIKAPTETVLVIDGDALVRIPICQYLRDCGYRVLEAANADEANHAPNENMEVAGFFRGIRTQCRVFQKLAGFRRP